MEALTGYTVLPGLLTEQQIDKVKWAVTQAPSFQEDERTRHINLLAVPELQFLPQVPVVLDYARTFLGKDCVLSGFSSHELPPGAGGMAPHVDWPYLSMPTMPSPYPILEMQAIWMLDDFTEENGATRVVPGSHLSDDKPDFANKSKAVTGKAGSVILSHGALWHSTGKNVTNKKRSAILSA
jgi:ectoine hydroxylase-related dioxygenase (phytanoyl-CoA dioxygenase family)